MKRKSSLDQAPVPNKRGRPPNDSLVNRNYMKQQTSAPGRTEEASAFDRGLEAEKVLGATDASVRSSIEEIETRSFFCRES